MCSSGQCSYPFWVLGGLLFGLAWHIHPFWVPLGQCLTYITAQKLLEMMTIFDPTSDKLWWLSVFLTVSALPSITIYTLETAPCSFVNSHQCHRSLIFISSLHYTEVNWKLADSLAHSLTSQLSDLHCIELNMGPQESFTVILIGIFPVGRFWDIHGWPWP